MAGALPLPPPKGGTMFRFFQIAPEKNEAALLVAVLIDAAPLS
jgi:hypothetical protein